MAVLGTVGVVVLDLRGADRAVCHRFRWPGLVFAHAPRRRGQGVDGPEKGLDGGGWERAS